MTINHWKVRELMARQQIANNKELAERVGVGQHTVGSWLTGATSITLESLASLCRVLECTPNDILDLERAPAKKEVALAASVAM